MVARTNRIAAIGWSLHVALVLLPFELVFWVGFSLPFGPVLAAGRTVLILISWWAVRGNS